MIAVTYNKFGTVEEFHLSDVKAPEVPDGHVRVVMKATSVNVIDSRIRNGMMGPLVNKKFPKIPGSDFSGVVDAVGRGATSFKVGDEVYGATDPFKGGAFAELIAVPENQIALKPTSLSFEQAASIPITTLAALFSLRDLGRIKTGDAVLVHGASGALGLSAIQLAKETGAKVTAVVGPDSLTAIKDLGADKVIDYRNQDGMHFDEKFDIIINASGKFPYKLARYYLKENGKMIEPSPTIPIFICSKIANFFRSKKHLMLQTMPNRQDLEILSLKVKSGNLKPIVASQYKLAEYRLAFSEMEKGGALGKIVVSVQ